MFYNTPQRGGRERKNKNPNVNEAFCVHRLNNGQWTNTIERVINMNERSKHMNNVNCFYQ